MNKIEPEAWKLGIDWQQPEGKGEGDESGKKGKGLVKECVWMTHGHGQQGGDWLWEQGCGLGGGEQRDKNWDNSNRTTVKYLIKKKELGKQRYI